MRESNYAGGITRRTFSRLVLAAGVSLFIPATSPVRALALNEKDDDLSSIGHAVFDDVGRACVIKLFPEKLIPSGKYAETVLMALCPERLLSKVKDNQQGVVFSGVSISDLPNTGQLFVPGDEKSSIDVFEIEELSPDLIVDIGDYKENHSDALDEVMRAVKTPTIFIDASFGNLPQAIRTLGQYLSCEDRADALANKFKQYFDWVTLRADSGTCHKSVLFCEGEAGLSVRGNLSYQSLAIAAVGCQNAASYQNDSNSIDVDVETIMRWNPDFVIFSNKDCFEKICRGEGLWGSWSAVPAIQKGDYCLSPALDSNWLGSPFFVQTLGVIWLWCITHKPDSLATLAKEAASFYDNVFGYDVDLSLIEGILSSQGVPRGVVVNANESEHDELASPSKVVRVAVREDGSVVENGI